MRSEMESMEINSVWTLVDPPKGIKPIGCKWIFKRKIGADGKVATYKAHLVAKGYHQHYSIDYDKTFSLVAMLKSIRIKTYGFIKNKEEPCIYKWANSSMVIFFVLYRE